MEVLRRKYLWLGLGLACFVISVIIRSYFIQFIFLGTLGVVGYFVYDALELIHHLTARNLADMQANMEIIMAERRISKDQLIHQKIQKDKK